MSAIFRDCTTFKANIVSRDMFLDINFDTNQLYLCLEANLKTFPAYFMNELTMILRDRFHIIVKNFSIIPERMADPNTPVEVLCIFFEQESEKVNRLISEAAIMSSARSFKTHTH